MLLSTRPMHHFILVVKWVCKVPILDIDMKTLMQEDSSLLLVSSFVMFQTQFVGYNHNWFKPQFWDHLENETTKDLSSIPLN